MTIISILSEEYFREVKINYDFIVAWECSG